MTTDPPDKARVPFFGGPVNGYTLLVDLPLPHTVLVDPPRTEPVITWMPEAMPVIAPAPPPPVEYVRRPRTTRGRFDGYVYIAAGYDRPPPALPLIPRRLADILEQHGMRDGVDFHVNPPDPPHQKESKHVPR